LALVLADARPPALLALAPLALVLADAHSPALLALAPLALVLADARPAPSAGTSPTKTDNKYIYKAPMGLNRQVHNRQVYGSGPLAPTDKYTTTRQGAQEGGPSAFFCNFLSDHGVTPEKVLRKAGLTHADWDHPDAVKGPGVTASAGQRRCGDSELPLGSSREPELGFDLSIAHHRFGSSSHVQQNGALSHPQDLDGPMRVAAQRKINAYMQQYADTQNVSFLPAIMMSKSTPIHGEFLRLIFLQAHGRPRGTSLPLECHRNAINRSRSVSSARHSTSR
jgi:hypothetical protein